MEVARDEMSAYNSIKRERQTPLPVDLHVSVLSASAWPTYPDVQVRIPPEIATAISDFEKFYDTKYNGRKLAWKHQLAHCQLRARFPNGNKELVVSSFQAIVLLLFNELPEGGTLNYRQIQEATTLCKSLTTLSITIHCPTATVILLIQYSRPRTNPNSPIPRMRKIPCPLQKAERQRRVSHRRILLQRLLHRP